MVFDVIGIVAAVSAPVASALGTYNLVRYVGIRSIRKARAVRKEKERDAKIDNVLSGLAYAQGVSNEIREQLQSGEASPEAEKIVAYVQKVLAGKKDAQAAA